MLRFASKYAKTLLRNPRLISTASTNAPQGDFAVLISFLAQRSLSSDTGILRAFELLNRACKPNCYALIHLIRACAHLRWFSQGQQLHCGSIKSGQCTHVYVSTALIHFYVEFELESDAHLLFDEILQPTLASWNSLISGYARSGQFRTALNLFLELESSDLCPDSFSFSAALSACGPLSLWQLGRSIHSQTLKLGAECSIVIGNCLIDMYGKCGLVEDSTRVFDEMIDKDNVSWNSILAANTRNGRLKQAFSVLHQIPHPDTISYNEMISGIAQFGDVEDAIDILSSMPHPNSSSWNAIITAYVNRGRAREALKVFAQLHTSDALMDPFTFSSILSGIAQVSAISWGNIVHSCTVKYGLDRSIVVGSALVNMYMKCAQIIEAELLFRSLPERNLVTWNAMISGYAHNGDFSKMISLFEQLKLLRDLQPDGITFLNVLCACWHNRLPLKVADHYFNSMINDYGIDPTVEHCSTMIRIMGQDGMVVKAPKMIKESGFQFCGSVWRALLGASVSCGDMEVAEVVAARVLLLGGDDEFVYIMMSNIYARSGKWKDASNTRKSMRGKMVRKEAGLSWIEGKIDFSHSSSA